MEGTTTASYLTAVTASSNATAARCTDIWPEIVSETATVPTAQGIMCPLYSGFELSKQDLRLYRTSTENFTL